MIRSLRKFWSLGVDSTVIKGLRRALGYQQVDATALAAAAVTLTFPTVTAGNVPGQAVTQVCPGLLLMQCNGGTARWRDDGTAPTSSVGMLMVDGVLYEYTGDIAKIQFIKASGTPLLEATLYA